MITAIRVPPMGESIKEATVTGWRLKEGDLFQSGAVLCELETDKITMELQAPSNGRLLKILHGDGATVGIDEAVAEYEEVGAEAIPEAAIPARPSAPTESGPGAEQPIAEKPGRPVKPEPRAQIEQAVMPSVRRLAEEFGIEPSSVEGSGHRGQVTKGDILGELEKKRAAPVSPSVGGRAPSGERETVVPMSRIRIRIAERLIEAQQTAAILTTFNEIDMTAVMELRAKYKEAFTQRHGVSPGFMSFFARAVVQALIEFPAVNAEIRGSDIVYKNYYSIGVAVGGPRGLVVPVVRDVDTLSFADIEREIARLATKVKDGTISLSDLDGGTFTISNGGVYGSLLSTPILNPPQSGILGMHAIQRRPIAIGDAVVIRPMMYVALSYDHRIVDGREAVSFLVRIKQLIEDPSRVLLDV
jgi:2-oxoglutarate dehydrogenase E2 component (dihydrolipoamide succinyltransferase)